MKAPRRRMHGESGASLIIAMGFLTVFAVTSVALLGYTDTSFKTSRVVRSEADQLYAADAGVEYGVQKLAADNYYTQCASSSSSSYSWTETVNGLPVTYSCQWVSGGTTTTTTTATTTTDGPIGGYGAILLRAGTGALQNTEAATINGNLYSKGTIQTTAPVTITGQLLYGPSSCPTSYVTYASCTAGVATPNPNPNPIVVVPSANAKASQAGATANCTILYPGKYGSGATALPSFTSSKRYYLASGTYYINNNGQTPLDGEIFGGASGTGTNAKQISTTSPCSTDTEANQKDPTYTADGKGVTIILGGSSRLVQSSGSTNIELFQRLDSVNETSSHGVSVWARGTNTGTTGGTYTPVTNSNLFALTGPTFIVHGATFIPNSTVQMNMSAPNSPNVGVFYGGLVANNLQLAGDFAGNLSGGGGSITITTTTTTTTNTARTVTLTAVATSPNGATSTVSATVQPDETTPIITNWRKTG